MKNKSIKNYFMEKIIYIAPFVKQFYNVGAIWNFKKYKIFGPKIKRIFSGEGDFLQGGVFCSVQGNPGEWAYSLHIDHLSPQDKGGVWGVAEYLREYAHLANQPP